IDRSSGTSVRGTVLACARRSNRPPARRVLHGRQSRPVHDHHPVLRPDHRSARRRLAVRSRFFQLGPRPRSVESVPEKDRWREAETLSFTEASVHRTNLGVEGLRSYVHSTFHSYARSTIAAGTRVAHSTETTRSRSAHERFEPRTTE